MKDLERLLGEGIETAYELQTRGSKGSTVVKERVIRRGRRRRAGRIGGSAVLSLALLAGATSVGSALLERDSQVASRQVPQLGAERVFGGGALATDGTSLWVGDGRISNTRGDKNSIARMDLATRKVVDGDPAVRIPQSMAWGESGLWTVSWEGDMPVGGEGHPVRGVIERVDPVTLERTGQIAREDSAPYDVAIGTVRGREMAWVVDMGRAELLAIDAASMEIVETHPVPSNSVSVTVYDRYVYVTSSRDHVVVRVEAESGKMTEFRVPDCANEVQLAGSIMWVADYCGDALLRMDTSGTGDTVSIPVGNGPSSVAIAEGLVWVLTEEGVVRVDPRTNEPVGDRVYVSEFPSGGLLYAGGDMWVSTFAGVYRLAEDVPPITPTPQPPSHDPRDRPLPAGVERVDIPREARFVATGAGSVWTGLFTVDRLDPESGEILAKIDPGGFVEAMDYDEDAGVLWALVEVAEKESLAVVAIDPESNEVALGPVLVKSTSMFQAMGAADGVAWVAGRGELFRVDSSTGESTEIRMDGVFDEEDAGSGFHVGVTHESVLVVLGNGTVVRVDPETFEQEKVEDLGPNVSEVLSDGEKVWVLHSSPAGDISVLSLDGSTGTRVGEPVAVSKYGFSYAAEYDGTIWVVQGGAEEGGLTLRAYEEGSTEPVRTVELPGGQFASDLAVGPSGAWVTSGHDFLYKVLPE